MFTYAEKFEERQATYLAELAIIPEEERVYVDETGIRQFLQRERALATSGKKVFDMRPGRRFKHVNIIGGMCGGMSILVFNLNDYMQSYTCLPCTFKLYLKGAI